MTGSVRLGVLAGVATALAATALTAVFTSRGWLLPVVGVVTVVTALGVAGRRLGLSAVLQPLLALAGVAAYVHLFTAPVRARLAAADEPDAGTVAAVSRLLEEAFVDMDRLGAPVPTRSGLLLLTVLGVGLVAVIVDLLAAGLRRPALAGFPLLALFLVPASVVPEGVGWLPFVLGAAGWLALLLAEGRERTGRWGSSLLAGRAGAPPRTPTGVDPLAQVGRRIGAAALGLAVAVPAALPGLEAGFLAGRGSGGFGLGGGSREITTYNPITRLKGQLVRTGEAPLLRITTDDPEPGYLRMTVLDRYTDQTWSQSRLNASEDERVEEGLPRPQGLTDATPTRTVRSDIEVFGLAVPWLPVPYPARRIDVEGDWRFDRPTETVFSTRTDTRAAVYRVRSQRVQPTPDQLAEEPYILPRRLSSMTQLPPIDPSVRQLVEEITAGASTPYEKAVALQAYFDSPGFTYSVEVPEGNGPDALKAFLENKQGFCEQYASAMAVMARAAGLAARVAIGFTRGREEAPGRFLVTTAEAHAWPEIYFPRAGWLPFEPTPRGDGQTVPPEYTTPSAGDAATGPDSGPLNAGDDAATDATDDGVLTAIDRQRLREEREAAALAAGQGGDGTATSGQDARRVPAVLLAAVGLVLLAAAPAALHAVRRRRRWRVAADPAARARAAWAQVRDDATDLGLADRVGDSPRAAAARLVSTARLAGEPADALARIVTAVERARYAPTGPAEEATSGLRADVRSVRRALAHVAPGRVRVRAGVLPASTLRTASGWTGARVADGLDAVDRTGARLRAALTGRSVADRRA